MKNCKIFLLTLFLIFTNTTFAAIEIIDPSGNNHIQADGDIFIDSQYFFAHVQQGLNLDAEELVVFFPNQDVLPSTSPDWTLIDGLFVNDSLSSILVPADFSEHISQAVSSATIYVLDTGNFSEVPLPSAALLFATAILGLFSRRLGRS